MLEESRITDPDGVTRDMTEAEIAEVMALRQAAGAAAVPEQISDRQFAQALALAGIITRPEAIAWAARGELPAALDAAIAAIPDADMRFSAEMLLSSATTYERHHPLVATLATVLKPGGYTDVELDALWMQAATL